MEVASRTQTLHQHSSADNCRQQPAHLGKQACARVAPSFTSGALVLGTPSLPSLACSGPRITSRTRSDGSVALSTRTSLSISLATSLSGRTPASHRPISRAIRSGSTTGAGAGYGRAARACRFAESRCSRFATPHDWDGHAHGNSPIDALVFLFICSHRAICAPCSPQSVLRADTSAL